MSVIPFFYGMHSRLKFVPYTLKKHLLTGALEVFEQRQLKVWAFGWCRFSIDYKVLLPFVAMNGGGKERYDFKTYLNSFDGIK